MNTDVLYMDRVSDGLQQTNGRVQDGGQLASRGACEARSTLDEWVHCAEAFFCFVLLQSHSSSANSSVDQATKTKRAKGQGSGSEEQPPPSAAWLPEVAAQCVSWGKSLHRPCFLATGTHSGLVRVDWVEGPLDQYAADFGVLTALGSRAWGQHQQPVVVVE